jgi:Putative Ig domain
MTRSVLLPLLVLPVVLGGCSGGGSSAAAVPKASPDSGSSTPHSPRISGIPPTAAIEGTVYSFKPNASDPDGDPLTFDIANLPAWATFDPSTGTLEGTPTPNDMGLHAAIEIRVSDGAGWATLPAFDITVMAVSNGALLVTWLPPTENTDDSPLNDLAGFNVYWGTELGALPNRVTVENPGVTAQVFEELPPGTYYFATTAFNAQGFESDLSDAAMVVVR